MDHVERHAPVEEDGGDGEYLFFVPLMYRAGPYLVDYILLTFTLQVQSCGQSALPILPDLQLPKQNQAYKRTISQLYKPWSTKQNMGSRKRSLLHLFQTNPPSQPLPITKHDLPCTKQILRLSLHDNYLPD